MVFDSSKLQGGSMTVKQCLRDIFDDFIVVVLESVLKGDVCHHGFVCAFTAHG